MNLFAGQQKPLTKFLHCCCRLSSVFGCCWRKVFALANSNCTSGEVREQRRVDKRKGVWWGWVRTHKTYRQKPVRHKMRAFNCMRGLRLGRVLYVCVCVCMCMRMCVSASQDFLCQIESISCLCIAVSCVQLSSTNQLPHTHFKLL